MSANASPHASPGLPTKVVLLFAIACGLAVGNVYYAQPLLDAMAHTFDLAPATVGIVITLTQVGYGLGLLLLVPLGDLYNRRRLIVTQTLLSVLALLTVALAPSSAWLLLGMACIGLLAVVTQVLVAYAANLAPAEQRGRTVGMVTSGVVVGILLARTVAGTMADLAGWRSVYLLSAGLTLLVALALWKTLPTREQPKATQGYGQLLGSLLQLFREEKVLRDRAVLAMLIFAAGTVLWTPLVLPLSAPPLSLSHTEIGLFGLAGAAGALGAVRAGHLADRGLAQWTSGLALGIDGAAHQAALEVGGRTVGVLGTGLENFYPQRHRALARAMIDQGSAVVSEFPLDTPARAEHFPRRNRIISGLSLGVLVVEASVASGSLITARLAAEQGREVYAIPGSIHHPGARGCHQLIRDGAVLVESVQHILETLAGWQNLPPSAASPTGACTHPLLALLHVAPHSSEALASASGWPLPRVLAALTELEIEGRAVHENGRWYARLS